MANSKTEPRLFTIIRNNDESGVSGKGRVLDGCVFPNGRVVICWRVQYQTIAVYESFEAFEAIHIASHPTNNTEIVWFNHFASSEPSKSEQSEWLPLFNLPKLRGS